MLWPSRKSAFWRSAPLLLEHRGRLLLAGVGAVISAACFGAGLGMLLPAFHLLLQRRESIGTLLEERVVSGTPDWLDPAILWLADRVPEDPFHAFIAVMAVVVALSIVGSAGRFLHEVKVLDVVYRVAMAWRQRMFARLIRAPLLAVLQHGRSDFTSRLLVDVTTLSGGYHAILGKTVGKGLHAVAALAGALWIDWRLTLIGLVGLPAIAVMLRKLGKRVRRASRRAMRERGQMMGVLSESLAHPRIVKTHTGEGRERRRFHAVNRALYRQMLRVRVAKALASPAVEAMALIGVAAAAGVCSWYIFRAGVAPESFMTVLTMLAAAGSSVKPLAGLNNTLQEAEAAAGRVSEVIGIEAEPGGPEDRFRPALRRHRDRVSFEAVSFTFPGAERPAVDGVSLEVRLGESVAVVGPNGSGKTTLLSLLPRLLEPEAGRVCIDGVDIATVSLRSLRRQMAVVSQEPVLFGGTIAENIAYGLDRVPSRQAIREAAETARAAEFIDALPVGFDTSLAEGGEGLSGGQRQRICIARAVLRNPRLLILDEATSQVDADSEAKINQALARFREGRTSFVIAHRLSTVIECDRIVVMDAGRLVDVGTHGALLERCEVYRGIAATQLQGRA